MARICTWAAPARRKARAATSAVAPGGHDIVHQQDMFSRHPRPLRHLEGAHYIAPPRLGRRHGALAGGGTAADQSGGVQGQTGAAEKGAGQLRRLIVTPPPKPEAMQRYRHDQVAARDQISPSPLQPLAEARHQIQPVGMLERQNGRAANFVIAQDGARPVEGRRMRQAGGALGIRKRHIKRNAAARAKRAIQELDRAPAAGAEARTRCRLTAGDAKGRKQKIE